MLEDRNCGISVCSCGISDCGGKSCDRAECDGGNCVTTVLLFFDKVNNVYTVSVV